MKLLVNIFGLAISISNIANAADSHVERFQYSFSLQANEEVAHSAACAEGSLISGGYTVNHSGRNIRATRSYPFEWQNGKKRWRIDVRNFSETSLSGIYNIHVLCSGLSTQSISAKNTIPTGTLYYQKFVHKAPDMNGDLVDVYDLFKANSDGTSEQRLTTAPSGKEHDSIEAAVSPDGNKIIFSTFRHRDGTDERNTGEIYLSSASGGNPQRLTNNIIDDSLPRWCGAGNQKIIYIRDGDIWQMDAVDADGDQNGDNASAIIATPEDEYDVDCSPNGSKIAFIRRLTNQQRQIIVANIDGTNEIALAGSAFLNALPRWSPDGTQILFSSDRASPPTGHYELYTMKPEDVNGDGVGDNLTQITTGSVGHGTGGGTWSSDGNYVFFHNANNPNSSLHIIDMSNYIVSPPIIASPPSAFANDWK